MKKKHVVFFIVLVCALLCEGCRQQPAVNATAIPTMEHVTERFAMQPTEQPAMQPVRKPTAQPTQAAVLQPEITHTLQNTEQLTLLSAAPEPTLQAVMQITKNDIPQPTQQDIPEPTQTSRWYTDTLDYHGVPIAVNGFVQPDFPTPMKQIRLEGLGLSKNTVQSTLQAHFDLYPSLELQGAEGYYANFTALDLDTDRWTYMNQMELEFDHSFCTDDPVIAVYYEECMAFLDDLGITGMRGVGLAAYFDNKRMIPPESFVQGSRQTLHILIPYDIGGLSTEYENMIVNRSLIENSDSTSRHIMDYPFAGFALDSQYRLIGMSMSFYQVATEKTIEGESIPWQQAVAAALDYEISDRYHLRQDNMTDDVYFDYFFDTYAVRVVRVFPMWMPGWLNGCLPGWCVQLHLYDTQTGEFLFNYALAVDAKTGEVIKNKHRED